MTRTTPRAARKPRPERATQGRAALVFRDFVRQLERLDTRPRKAAREGSR
jgi:hypothetical protein